MPLRFLNNPNTVTRVGKDIKWDMSGSFFAGVTYYLNYNVKLDKSKIAEENIDKYVSANNFAYFTGDITTMQQNERNNFRRFLVVKNFPSIYVQPSNKKPPIIYNVQEKKFEYAQVIGAFPVDLNAFSIPYYTASVTPAPKKILTDEHVDESTEAIPATGYKQIALISICVASIVAAFIIYRKKRHIKR